MNPNHAYFAQWDAAFVMGALSWADRAAYEEHLSDCSLCRHAVVELAPTAALLSRVSREEELRGLVAAASDPSMSHSPSIPAAVAAETSRRPRAWWWVAAAVAIVVAAAGVGIPLVISSMAPTAYIMQAVEDVPLDATVRLDAAPWGTRIDLECVYTSGAGADTPEGGWPYSLAVVGTDGAVRSVSTWRALPGSTARVSAGVALDVAEISAIEIRSMSSERVLMRFDTEH